MWPARWVALVLVLALLASPWLPGERHLPGHVRDAHGPITGARLRYQGDHYSTHANAHGHFRLPWKPGQPRFITAWKEGYAIAGVSSSKRPLDLFLRPLPTADHDDYAWIDSVPDRRHRSNCANCHEQIYQEWAGSAHGRSASNRRLLNLFAGRDWHDRPSPRWSLHHEYPLGKSVCATCHAPTFADPTLDYDLTQVSGVAARGVHCDYCHKIVAAPTDKLGTRFGRDGLMLLRPPPGELLSFGPLDDSLQPGEAFAFSPLYKESRYCASCHEGILFGVHVYGTFSEWLTSPASKQGRQCQDCHMTPDGTLSNIAPGHGGVDRDPRTLASHRLLGGHMDMLRRCLTVTAHTQQTAAGVHVVVTLRADDVGHRVPTGFIDRHLLLMVEGFDAMGRPVAFHTGPTLPPYAGQKVSGQPGWLYAKQLHADDGRTPLPFWLPSDRLTDTRLLPGQPDQRVFVFAPDTARLRLRVLYRRFWPEVADAKGWPANEMSICDKTYIVNR